MRIRVVVAVGMVFLWAPMSEAAEPASLANARALYNAGMYDAAIVSASAARNERGYADSSALVMARAQLERFRLGADPADLTTARETLGTIRAPALSARDQVDLLIGLGQALYLSNGFGAAAELFETALGRGAVLGARDRVRLLDWWATAIEREAQTRSTERRNALFQRIATRMEAELRVDPGSVAANYWLAVAARGEGDLDRAWDTASAAWVRAVWSPETSARLREDIDGFVTQILIPDRVRSRSAREQPEAAAALQAEWDVLKEQWK
jgi:hypothetical protein